MTRNQIIEAINTSNYQALLDIYKQYKINNKFDQFFASVQNADTNSQQYKILLGKVKDILRKLEQNNEFTVDPVKLDNLKPEPITLKPLNLGKAKTIERVIIDSNPHVNRADLPEELQKVYDENGKMHQEMKSKHAAMKVEADPANRKILVNELTALEDQLNSNWSKIDKWWNSDKNAESKKEESESPESVIISLKIGAAKRYIGRYYKSEKPEQICKVKEYTEFLNSLNLKFTPKNVN